MRGRECPASVDLEMTLRIWADFNAVYGAGDGNLICWCLRYDEKPLEHGVERLGLKENMPVVLYYSDGPEGEEFEFDGILIKGKMVPWEAKYDRSTYRPIREEKLP